MAEKSVREIVDWINNDLGKDSSGENPWFCFDGEGYVFMTQSRGESRRLSEEEIRHLYGTAQYKWMGIILFIINNPDKMVWDYC